MTLKEKQQRIFKKYALKYGEFVVGYHPNQRARWSYYNYNSPEYKSNFRGSEEYANHRYIFPDEIVVDVDTKDEELYEHIVQETVERLIKYKLDYTVWDTGGELGYHIHFSLPFLSKLDHEDRVLAKREILKKMVPSKYHKHIDFQLCSKHLIRAEYGRYEKTYGLRLSHKTLVERKSFKSPVFSSEEILYSVKESKKRPRIQYNFKTKGIPDCIKFLQTEDFRGLKDGRDRACFIIGTYYLRIGKKEEEVITILRDYNKYYLNNKFNEYQLRSKIQSWIKSKMTPGAKYTHDLLKELGKSEVCKMCR